jgi:predicted ATP-dependent serine protease
MYGRTLFSDGSTEWGMPVGKISLWAGESGVGKSRLSLAVAKKLSTGCRVLYFQNEAPLGDLKSWMGDNNYNEDNFYCSDADTLKGQLTAIAEVDPLVVFVDSVNKVKDFRTGTTKYVNMVIEAYRQVGLCSSNCHIILLGQLNQNGTIKGSTTLPHLVDTALSVEHACKKSKKVFVVKFGVKHRYGPTDRHIMSFWEHGDSGVESISDYSLEDEKWCESHGIPVKSPFSLEELDIPKSTLVQDLRQLFLGR